MTYADSMQELIDHDSGQDMPVPEVTEADKKAALKALLDEDVATVLDEVLALPFWREHFEPWVLSNIALQKDLFDRPLIIDKAAELAEKRAERQRECDAADAAFEEAA